MILDKILEAKRAEVAERKVARPMETLEELARTAPPVRDFAGALRRSGTEPIRLIAEFKRASPSRGLIRGDLDPADVARRYQEAGAAAMSVLTDGPFFSGSLDDLRAARHSVEIPLLRKDFVLDRYQLLEARCAGADAVLLIAAALDEPSLVRLHAEALALGLACLVEVHDDTDLACALAARPLLIGINNRDLRTFRVDLRTTLHLRGALPSGVVVVSESGIHARHDALLLQDAGVDAMLVGESLMRQSDPGRAARALLGK